MTALLATLVISIAPHPVTHHIRHRPDCRDVQTMTTQWLCQQQGQTESKGQP